MKKVFYTGIALIFFSCNGTKTQKAADICIDSKYPQQIEAISFNDIKSIKKLNGSFVQMEGFFHYNFEDVALYPSKSSDVTEAISLNLAKDVEEREKDLEALNNKNIIVIGKIDITKRGHFNGYIATLDSAFCIKAIK